MPICTGYFFLPRLSFCLAACHLPIAGLLTPLRLCGQGTMPSSCPSRVTLIIVFFRLVFFFLDTVSPKVTKFCVTTGSEPTVGHFP